MQQDEVSAPRQLYTVKQFAERFPAWSEASLRALIFSSQERVASGGRRRIGGNGMQPAGVIIRCGRRILICERSFFRWLAEEQTRPTRKAAQ